MTTPFGSVGFVVPKISGKVEGTSPTLPVPSKCLYPNGVIAPLTAPFGIFVNSSRKLVPTWYTWYVGDDVELNFRSYILVLWSDRFICRSFTAG